MHFSREAIEQASTPEELQAILSAGATSSGRWVANTLSEVAEFFGLATSTVKGWSQEGMPGSDDGWSLPAIVRWRHAKLIVSDLATQKKQQDLELGAVQLEAKRLEIAKEKGELLDRGDVERFVATAIIEQREILMSLPEKIATSAPPEIRETARREADLTCRAACSAFRRRLEMNQLDDDATTGDVADDDYEPTKRTD